LRKRKINWDKQIQYAQRQLDLNKANIDNTHKGTTSQKASTWSRKPRQNRSKVF
jgi:hypothetical protein